MGVKGLSPFVKPFGKVKNLSQFRGKTVAIDAPIYMFRFKYLCDTTTFIERFKLQMQLFKSLDISCLYVFDGVHPDLKQETRETRKKTQTIFITQEDIALLKETITDSGYHFTVAPGEAEKLCSYLNSEKIVDFVMSNDYDTFAFGCKTLLVSSGTSFIEYRPREILSELCLSRPEFLDICIAAGCDFFAGGIPGIGIKKAIKLVENGKNIEEWGGSDEFYSLLPTIKNIFTDFTKEAEVLDSIKSSLLQVVCQSPVPVQEEILLTEEDVDSCDESDGL